jgi:hypothetical protein
VRGGGRSERHPTEEARDESRGADDGAGADDRTRDGEQGRRGHYKEHDPREPHLHRPLGWIVDGAPNHRGYLKADALTAEKAMTAPAVTIAPWEPVSEAARLMCERRVNRLPVVQHDRLAGIVTRSDLVRAFTRTDAEIEREIREDVLQRTMWIETGKVEVAVRRGQARLIGALEARSDVELLTTLVRRVPGGVAVESTVAWGVDDTTRGRQRRLERLAR